MAHTHKLKLTYFDIDGGRGEPIRLAFHIGGIHFEDHRVKGDQWPAMKASTPLGTLPVLEVDGCAVTQSNAILTFAGRLSNLYPSDPVHALRVDECVNAIDDGMQLFSPVFAAPDDKKAELVAEILKNKFLPFLERVEKIHPAGTWCHGDHMTVADIKCATVLNGLVHGGRIPNIPKDILHSFPKLEGTVKAVLDHPKVKEYYEARKKH